ncbi:VWFA and cache domain-containing protein CG16868 [Plodia interpunctella]|uniref:VWFA and cache domain-containing protein CG16868 n=1 Tax=Plodia interpunctella TaxID=58824 RepID=UPI0023674ED9|nr:VWFA and cache domain-containing protein CG16868 [Plodia interpunctella]
MIKDNADTMKLLSLLLTITSFGVSQIFAQNDNCTRTNSRGDYKLCVRKLADSLSNKFNEIILKELGSEYTTHYEIRNSHKVNRYQASDNDTLNDIAGKLNYKLSSAKNILKDMKNITGNNNTPSYTNPCPFNSIRKSVFIKSSSNLYDNFPIVESKSKMMDRFKDLKVKRQYFLSHMDYATDRDCTTMPHSNLRYLYHSVVNPDPKLVVFIIDNNMNPNSLQHAINVAKETVYSLQPTDYIALKMTNTTEFVKFDDTCSNDGTSDVGNATDNNKMIFREYTSSIEATFSNMSPLAINEELHNLLNKKSLPLNKLFILLTDTKVLKNETWLKIFPYSDYDSKLKFAIGLIYENQAERNSSLGILHIDKWHNNSNNHSVMRVHINDSAVIGQVASAFLSLLPGNYNDDQLRVIGPTWEATERDFMISLMLPTGSGVLGLDLYWSDLAEDIVYFRGVNLKKRAFVMDFAGKVLMHTFFPRPEISSEKIKFIQLEQVETYSFIPEVKKQMLNSSAGSVTMTEINCTDSITYSWKWVDSLYIVCIVSEVPSQSSLNSSDIYFTRNNKEILFHRLDLFPPKNGKICRHFKQIATIDQGTVYLSPSSFQSPFTYLYDMADGQEAVTYMQNYLAYLKSLAYGLLSNPGLKSDIQHDVNYLNSILSFYKRQHLHGAYSKYIVRRYAVTESGVLVMFPGTVLEYDYEPVKRPWYTYALENQGKVILTPPNLDVGGAGYIVSISYAVRKSNFPTVVVAMDVTMGFLYKMLIDSLPLCAVYNIKCFVMNNKGYLVSHPGLMDPNSSGPIEQQHITHKESMIAIDMLNHKGFVTKRLCNNFYDNTIQRFYEFNTSLSSILSNVATGPHCVHYYIAAIPGTNAFIGLVNASCNIGVFCPCSMIDRLCLNCNRMEQTECECPCECSSELYHCPNANVSRFNQDIPLCGMTPEHNNHKSHYFHNFAENLNSCFDFQCESYTTHSSCLGVLGCEWCQIDADAKTPLAAPFCTSQSTCFNGVLGAVTPYGEGTFGHVNRDAFGSYSAIGPIAGCIVTVSLIIAVAAYCYRQNVTSVSCHNLYVDGPAETWHDPDVQLSHLQSDDMHDKSGQDKLLPAMEIEAPISPYRVITGYRRAHTAGGSDHGYSTMTPHEDSEATGFSVNDPIILSDDTKSDVSCPLPAKIKPRLKTGGDLTVTVLPCGKNSIIAPVTVHRHMEAS